MDSAWMGDQIWIARIGRTVFFSFSPSFSKAISRSAELPSLCNVVSSIYQLFVPHYGRIYVYLFNNELHYRMNKQREMSFEFSSNLSTVDFSKHLIIAWIIRKFIQLVNFVTFSVFYFFLGNRVWRNLYERTLSGNETSIITSSFYLWKR